jgi:hypothetical protein
MHFGAANLAIPGRNALPGSAPGGAPEEWWSSIAARGRSSACPRSLFLWLDLLFFTPPERVPTLLGAPVLLWSILSTRFALLPASKPSTLVLCDSPTTPLTSYQRIRIRIILTGHGEEKEAFLGTSRSRRSARYPVKTNKSTSAPV